MTAQVRGSLVWRAADLEAVAQAIRLAADGTPVALRITGDAGTGKSTLLERTIAEAEGFAVLYAEGDALRTPHPYEFFNQLLPPEARVVAAATQPFYAAQALRRAIEAASGEDGGPVLLALDDIQWADAESIAALRWVLVRAAGDRLAVVAANRPSARDDIGLLVDAATESIELTLSGLDAEQVDRLIRSLRPDIDPDLAGRLWFYTGGNPLAIRQLLAEVEPDVLARMTGIPVPRALVERMRRRLAVLPEPAQRLAEALAILGPSWVDADTAAAIAGLDDRDAALGELVADGLVVRRSGEADALARIHHEVARDTVVSTIEPRQRRALHLRASEVSVLLGERLRHRVRAALGPDAALAEELTAYARAEERDLSHLVAAEYLEWASEVHPDPLQREALHLDALYASVNAGDRAHVLAELERIDGAVDPLRLKNVRARLAMLRYLWQATEDVLATVAEDELSATDPLTRFRYLGMRAASLQYAGVPPAEFVALLDRAWAEPVRDAALEPIMLTTVQQARMPNRGYGEPWVIADVRGREPLDVLILPSRGGGLGHDHRLDLALADLEEYRQRVEDGAVERNGGAFLAILGYIRWMTGDVGRAAEIIRQAAEQEEAGPHPGVMSFRPLLAIAEGRPQLAAEYAEESRRALLRAQWRMALYGHVLVEGIRLDVYGTPNERRLALDGFRRDFGDLDRLAAGQPVMAIATLVNAALWADEPEAADDLVARLVIPPDYSPGAERVREWLEGRVLLHRGRPAEAIERLRAALGAGASLSPYTEGRTLEDLADALDRVGEAGEAATLRAQASARLRRMGLTHLVQGESEQPAAHDPFVSLSVRERDVAELVIRGLSYEQIAKRLFVTRSTVAFHLAKVYAKTNTRRRHELLELAEQADGQRAAG